MPGLLAALWSAEYVERGARRLGELGHPHHGSALVTTHRWPFRGISINLYVLAFSADRTRFDRLLDFSRPASAAYYFAPALNVLEELVGPG